MKSDVPVVLIFFKRLSALKVLNGIRTYRPTEIFLLADGGRTKEEHKQCIRVREAVENAIDWPCKIEKTYSDTNIGCRIGIPRGLDWVFNQVEKAIILEDDCVPSSSFFPFCEEMLERFATDTRIHTISGSNYLSSESYFGEYSYLFSGYSETCGWATWKRTWKLYDKDMILWPQAKQSGLFEGLFLSPQQLEYWESIFQGVYDHTCSCDPWDYQWLFASWINSALSIVPRANLITNIGYNIEATHSFNEFSPLANVPIQELQFPLSHPLYVARNTTFDMDYGNLVFYGGHKTFFGKIREKLVKLSLIKENPSPKSSCFHFESLRRLTPVSSVFGFDRGQPVDRYYIEAFLKRHSDDIRGRVLEIGDSTYTHKFGRKNVTQSDVLHAVNDNPQATLVGDLATGKGIPQNTFDCLILTQTLPFIYDVRAAVANSYSALKPGGVLLATFPCISQISRYDMDRWGDYWRFTDASARRLFGDVFGLENVTVETYGNVLVACASLHGLAAYELKPEELDYHDPDYQVIITVRAVKPVGGG